MKNVIIASLAVGVVLFLSGCGEEPKSIEYFMQHPDEADKIAFGKCQQQGSLSKNEIQECNNAGDAIGKLMVKKSNEALKKS
ncbi:EexN family lipoprotein [Campylobacter geochelonis]|uniref:EexN family lipoprotein n=1 Tax=Campylobacter geochelonis TaxID=1780362 RepID=UPI0007706E34|nr:EexN family lipoprotein [Campylobacter geochelonis]CZE50468.1 Uncharacterised protein [Campylobacter geochelonis]